MYTKLDAFLDSFQNSFKDLVQGNEQGGVNPHNVDLDSLFGDCKDILMTLLELVERFERFKLVYFALNLHTNIPLLQ